MPQTSDEPPRLETTSAEILDAVDSWQVVARACGGPPPMLMASKKREKLMEVLGVSKEVAFVLFVADSESETWARSSKNDSIANPDNLTRLIGENLQVQDAQTLAKELLNRAGQYHAQRNEEIAEALQVRKEQADAEFWPEMLVGCLGVLAGLVICTAVSYGGFALAWEFLGRTLAKLAFLGGILACMTGAVNLYRAVDEGRIRIFCGGVVLGSVLGAVLTFVLLWFNY